MGKSYHIDLEATPTVIFAFKKRERERESLAHFHGGFCAVEVLHPGASRVSGVPLEASVEDYRIQRSLETPAAPSLLATTVSLRSDAVKTNPDWSGLS